MISMRWLLLLFAALAWMSGCYPEAGDDDTGPAGDDDDVSDDDATEGDDDDDVSDDDDDSTEGDDDDDTGGVEDVPAGAVLINEIMFNPSAANDTDGEWFELANTTGGDIDLQGCTLSDSVDDSHTIGGPLVVPANGFAVLGISSNDAVNGGVAVDYEYSNITLKNSDTDQLILVCVGEVDRVEWAFPGWPGDAGVSMNFDGTHAPDNDDPAHWCDASTQMPNDDWGTPGADNDSCGGGTGTIEPDDVVFSEVMQNPGAVSDPDGEWFELLNTTSNDLNLAGCEIRDDGADSHTISGTLTLPAHGRVVLGYSDDPAINGGVSVDYEYGSSVSLGNGEDELVLDCDGEVDRIEYDNGVTWPNVNGASMNLDEIHALDNHMGNHWCESTTDMGTGDHGTPGAPNISC